MNRSFIIRGASLATLTCGALLTVASIASAAGWGTLSGKFVLQGKAPTLDPVKVDKDQAVCTKVKLVNEDLVVDAAGGIADVAVWLRPEKGQTVPVHPDLEKKAPKQIVLDNKNCRFAPHIAVVWVGKQELVLKNSDPVGHNANLQPFGLDGINPLLPPTAEVEYKFAKEVNLPAPVTCNIHSWMKGFVVAKSTPYVAITKPDGSFSIANVPAGKWTFQAWHAKSGYVVAKPDWKLGRFTVDIKDGGKTDLGTVNCAAAMFNK